MRALDALVALGWTVARERSELRFQSLDDFAPERVAEQVEPLRKLLELRRQLADLRGSLQGNDKLDEILQSTLSSEGGLDKLKAEMTPDGANDGEK